MDFPEPGSEWVDDDTGSRIVVDRVTGEGPRAEVKFWWFGGCPYGHKYNGRMDSIPFVAFAHRFEPYTEATPTRFDRIADQTVEDDADLPEIIAKVGMV